MTTKREWDTRDDLKSIAKSIIMEGFPAAIKVLKKNDCDFFFDLSVTEDGIEFWLKECPEIKCKLTVEVKTN